MKKLFFIFLLLPVICQAQQWQRQHLRKPLYNAISLSIEPTGGGKLKYTKLGLRYDRIFTKYGFYTSGSYGSYEFIRSSTKLAVGGTLISKTTFATIGGAYHINRGISADVLFDRRALTKWGCEIGAGKLFNRFVVAFRYELRLSNASVDIGYRF